MYIPNTLPFALWKNMNMNMNLFNHNNNSTDNYDIVQLNSCGC